MEFEEETDDSSAVEALYRAASPVTERIPDFSGVVGVCRTCTHAFLYQRAYGDEIHVTCDAIHPPMRMPLDIVKCSRFEVRGQQTLRELSEMARLVSKEPIPGQYL